MNVKLFANWMVMLYAGFCLSSFIHRDQPHPGAERLESIARYEENIRQNGRYVPPLPRHSEFYCLGVLSYEGVSYHCNYREQIEYGCRHDPSCIGSPGYSVTESTADVPVLATMDIISCVGIVIYHPESTKGLMAHLHGEKNSLNPLNWDLIPNEEYIKFFKQEHFGDIPNNELRVWLGYGKRTRDDSIEMFESWVGKHFEGAKIKTKRIATQPCHRADMFFDTRTGYLDMSSREVNRIEVDGLTISCFPDGKGGESL